MSTATATETTYFRYDGSIEIVYDGGIEVGGRFLARITEVRGRAEDNWENCLQTQYEEEREKRYCGTLDHVLSNVLFKTTREGSEVEVTLLDGKKLLLKGKVA